MKFKYLLLCLFCAVAGAGFGQGDGADYRFFHRLEDDGTLKVRLMPLHRHAFFFANDQPQQLEVYALTPSGKNRSSRLVQTTTLAPLARQAWQATFPTTQLDTAAFTGIYFPQLSSDFIADTFMDDAEEEDPDGDRFAFTNFALNHSFELIQKAGYGHEWTVDPTAAGYVLKFFPTPSGDTLYYEVPTADYHHPAVPELRAKFKNKRSKLDWNIEGLNEQYFGYQLFRSVADGPYEPIYQHALITAFDTTINLVDATNNRQSRSDILDQNDVRVSYRLHGADYLGGYSKNYSEKTGVSGSDLERSPLLLNTVQTDSNYAVINWEYDVKYEPFIQEFRILHRDQADGKSRVIMTGITAEKRTVSLPMSHRSNFYRVQVVSTQGTELSSFESLVLAYDTEPPATPTGLAGYIDTLGHVHLSWQGSEEADLAGYYLFKGLVRDQEKAMFTSRALTTTTYVDTVNMKTGNDTMFYQVRSVDLRGNSSNFSPLLALVKPDVFPPAPPQFSSVNNTREHIELSWSNSPSPDVVTYRLYRREGEKAWTLHQQWSSADYPDSFVDSLVQQNTNYAYFLEAIDDADLVSERSEAVSARLKDYGLRGPITDVTAIGAEENRAVAINWVYEEQPRTFHLYRGELGKPLSLLKELGGTSRGYRDGGVIKGRAYRYLLRAVFPNGKSSPFSGEAIVDLREIE